MPFDLNLPLEHISLDADSCPICDDEPDQFEMPCAQQLYGQISGMMSLVRIWKSLHKAELWMKLYDGKGRRDVDFSVGQEVRLSTKYQRLSVIRSRSDITTKFLSKYVGSFTITKAIA